MGNKERVPVLRFMEKWSFLTEGFFKRLFVLMSSKWIRSAISPAKEALARFFVLDLYI